MRRAYLAPLALAVALLAVRLASFAVVFQPGYTDAYYYFGVAERVARGEGLTIDAVFSFLEAPGLAALPVPSHRFWMPLATLVQAAGIWSMAGLVGPFRAAQLATVLFAAAIPVLAWLAARSLGASSRTALLAGAVAGLGGAFAPAWVSLDSFPIAAVAGTLFFLLFARAARGGIGAGAACGVLVGLLYLARAEGALFGLALLWLALRPRSRVAGSLGALVAVAFGLAWLARNSAVGLPDDLLARAFLPVRYQDTFALHAPSIQAFVAAGPAVALDRVAALWTNAITAAMAVMIVPLVPLAVALRRRWDRPEVRAFAGLVLVVYLAESLAFTVHSVRGSYFHSLAAFFPFAIALSAAGVDDLLSRSTLTLSRVVAAATTVAFGAVSVFALGQWDVAFNGAFRTRAAAVEILPPGGPLMAADAAAWRWIAGRPVVVTPADGPRSAVCVAEAYSASALILEPGHFSAYDEMYDTRRSDLFTFVAEHDGIEVFIVRPDARCALVAISDPVAERR